MSFLTELLNDYFSSTFQIDNNVISNCPPPLPTLSFERKLNPKSAGEPDSFHPILFKNFNESLSQPLVYLFSLSYAHSFLPTSWRHAYITPIFKKGDPSCAANYRPISLTSTACKLMESIVKDIIC